MRKFNALRILFVGLIFGFILIGCGKNSKVTLENVGENQTFYTQVNMWYYKKSAYGRSTSNDPTTSDAFISDYTISSTNYQFGELLPINSEIKILKLDVNKIFFEYQGQSIGFVRTKHSKHKSLNQLFERTFAKTQVDLTQFSEKALNEIIEGKVEPGMTKDALILSRGYPPEHRTNDLALNQWYYWKSVHNSIKLTFDGEVLKKILD